MIHHWFSQVSDKKISTRGKDDFCYHSTTQTARHYKFSLNVPNEYIDEGYLELIFSTAIIEGNTSVNVLVIVKDPKVAMLLS